MSRSDGDSERWAPGSRVDIRELVSEKRIGENVARQLVMPGGSGRIVKASGVRGTIEPDGGGDHLIALLKPEPGQSSPYLVAPVGARTLTDTDPGHLSWTGRPPPMHPDTVRDCLRGRFRMVADADRGHGLRVPQVGAVHTVLGYWTTDPRKDATVVMPTGTGKTDTMVALFVASCPERLLVMVPSDALRTQLADKFGTLGVLPAIGALGDDDVTFPVVGRLEKGFKTTADASSFARACNVVVTTPHALNACSDEARLAFTEEFSDLFVDEAHHIRAATWEVVRNRFERKRVVQFTATPYREDGQDLGGRLIYVFPLRLAQEMNYFSHINYRGVRSMAYQDRTVAETALTQLRTDLDAGLDHVIMARVKTRPRADEIVQLYEELAPEFGPRVLYSGMTPASASRAAQDALADRTCRVIVCVDMLGEGFDLPALKIAAMHDAHKSLGITLQFIGRFARVAENVGDATVVVGRPDAIGDEALRALYAEDPDWNLIVRDLSEAATTGEQEASDFDDGFVHVPVGLATHQLQPKMSTVVYKTRCDTWQPQAAVDFVGSSRLLTNPVPLNGHANVAWFIVRDEGRSPWGPDPGYVNVAHDLYVMYWDRSKGLLYVNSSNNDSPDKHHQRLAECVAGDDVERIRGDAVFRVFGGVDRLVPTNVGLLDIRSRARKHAQYAGANVNEGFPEAEKETKTQTNIFAHGHDDGQRVQLGASLAGRVWARRVAASVLDWVQWCDETGGKLTNSSLDIDEILARFIRPELLDTRPPLVVLGVEWPAVAYTSLSGDARTKVGAAESPLIDTELRVTDFSSTGPISIEIVTDDWSVPYDILITEKGIEAQPVSGATVDIVTSSREVSFSEYVRERGLTLLCEKDAMIEHPGVLYLPNRDLPAFPRDGVRTHISWDGIDLTVESQGAARRADSIQRRVIEAMIKSGQDWTRPGSASTDVLWELIVDDDGCNELADVVAMRRESSTLHVQLVHCKYSSEPTAGARIDDLYEVCGQAQKSVARRRDLSQLLPHLIRRERRRQARGRTGIEIGNEELLYDIEGQLRLLKLELSIVVVQPGMSAANASNAQLDLLAATEMFVLEVGGASFDVIASC